MITACETRVRSNFPTETGLPLNFLIETENPDKGYLLWLSLKISSKQVVADRFLAIGFFILSINILVKDERWRVSAIAASLPVLQFR